MKANTKKAAVYDRWLHRLGGGEQLAFAYAKALHEIGYDTDMISHLRVERRDIERKMKIDLEGIHLVQWPDLPDSQLGPLTKSYDIFISNSYLDYILPQSKYSLLSIFFPSKLKLSLMEHIKITHDFSQMNTGRYWSRH